MRSRKLWIFLSQHLMTTRTSEACMFHKYQSLYRGKTRNSFDFDDWASFVHSNVRHCVLVHLFQRLYDCFCYTLVCQPSSCSILIYWVKSLDQIDELYFLVFSINWFRVTMWWIVEKTFLNPACSLPWFSSSWPYIRFFKSFPSTLTRYSSWLW